VREGGRGDEELTYNFCEKTASTKEALRSKIWEKIVVVRASLRRNVTRCLDRRSFSCPGRGVSKEVKKREHSLTISGGGTIQSGGGGRRFLGDLDVFYQKYGNLV